MVVNGPGQNFLVNNINKSLVLSSISTKSNAYYYDVTWTITGSDKGLSI